MDVTLACTRRHVAPDSLAVVRRVVLVPGRR